MKKGFYPVFLLIATTILLIGCVPASAPKPAMTQFVMPKGDFEMSWDIYNSEYNSMGGTLTIHRQGTKYSEKLVMSDGSSTINELTVISEGSEIKLTGHLGITTSAYGDYMVINKYGWLGFYDDKGYIYGVPPLK
ncbi:MAG: hypothetical protein U0X74_00535 [Anaerolineales bacterium]